MGGRAANENADSPDVQSCDPFCEAQTDHPPAHLLPSIADALGISVDQLLGRDAIPKRKAPQNERLMRQLRQVEKLPPRARQSVLEHIEALTTKYGSHD